MTALAILLTLPAQPPTAPPPRAVPPVIGNLTWTYTGPPKVTDMPKLEMSAADGRVEVRWTMDRKAYSVTAPRVIVRDGLMSCFGTKEDLVVMSVTEGDVTDKFTAREISISLTEATVKIGGPGILKREP